MDKSVFSRVHDLNLISCVSNHCQMLSGEVDHAFRTIGICSSHGVFAAESFQSDGGSETCSTQSPGLQLPGSVLDACLCATDGTRIVARYRDQFASATQTFLPYGGCVARRSLATLWPTQTESDPGKCLPIWPVT